MLLHITQIVHYYTYYTNNKTTLPGRNNNDTFIVTVSTALQLQSHIPYLTRTIALQCITND